MKNRAIVLNNLFIALWTASPAALRHDPRSWLNEECNAYVEWWEANKLTLWTLVLGPDLEQWIRRYNAARARLVREYPDARLPGVARPTTLLTAPRQVMADVSQVVEDTAKGAVGIGAVVLVIGAFYLFSKKGR